MKTKRKIAGHDWELDDETIVVTIPMQWKRRGGRKVIIAPDGGDAWAPAKPRPDEAFDPCPGAGASVEEVARGGEVSVGGGDRRGGRRDA